MAHCNQEAAVDTKGNILHCVSLALLQVPGEYKPEFRAALALD